MEMTPWADIEQLRMNKAKAGYEAGLLYEWFSLLLVNL
jgi:hypothetical protein